MRYCPKLGLDSRSYRFAAGSRVKRGGRRTEDWSTDYELKEVDGDRGSDVDECPLQRTIPSPMGPQRDRSQTKFGHRTRSRGPVCSRRSRFIPAGSFRLHVRAEIVGNTPVPLKEAPKIKDSSGCVSVLPLSRAHRNELLRNGDDECEIPCCASVRSLLFVCFSGGDARRAVRFTSMAGMMMVFESTAIRKKRSLAVAAAFGSTGKGGNS